MARIVGFKGLPPLYMGILLQQKNTLRLHRNMVRKESVPAHVIEAGLFSNGYCIISLSAKIYVGSMVENC